MRGRCLNALVACALIKRRCGGGEIRTPPCRLLRRVGGVSLRPVPVAARAGPAPVAAAVLTLTLALAARSATSILDMTGSGAVS